MKRVILIGAALLMVAGVALAGHQKQGHGPHGPGFASERHAEHVIESLNLSGAQADQVRELFATQHEAAKAMRQEIRAQIHATMCAMHADTKEQLGGILNEEQMAELNVLHEEHQGKKGRRGDRLGGCDQ